MIIGKKKTSRGFDWMRKKLPLVQELPIGLSQISDEILYEQGSWTALKELFLFTYISDIYTTIIPKYFPKMYFLDLLSGPGLVRIKETGDLILGSPLIAALASRRPFSDMFFVDINQEYLVALNERFRWLDSNVNLGGGNRTCILGDCNNAIPGVLERMKGQGHFLAFVDCEGMDVDWGTMERLLLTSRGDIILTFHTKGIWRVRGEAIKEGKLGPMSQKMTSFVGSEGWRECASMEELLELYKRNFTRYGRDLVESIAIKKGGQGGYHYDLVFATRETKGGSPWMQAVYHIKDRIEQNTGEAAQWALDILAGRQSDLDYFISKD